MRQGAVPWVCLGQKAWKGGGQVHARGSQKATIELPLIHNWILAAICLLKKDAPQVLSLAQQ